MGLSDAEYERIVLELKARKSHRGDEAKQTTLWASTGIWMQCCTQIMGGKIAIAAGPTNTQHASTTGRGEALLGRVRALSKGQVTEKLEDVTRKHANAAKAASPIEGADRLADRYDRQLAEIEVELAAAEMRPA